MNELIADYSFVISLLVGILAAFITSFVAYLGSKSAARHLAEKQEMIDRISKEARIIETEGAFVSRAILTLPNGDVELKGRFSQEQLAAIAVAAQSDASWLFSRSVKLINTLDLSK